MKKTPKRKTENKRPAPLFPNRFTLKEILLINTQSARRNDYNKMPAQTQIEFKVTAKQDKKKKVLFLVYGAKMSMYSKESETPENPFFVTECNYHISCVPTKKTFPRISDKEIEKQSSDYVSERIWPYIREHFSLTMAQLRAPLLSLPTNWEFMKDSFK